jgi:diguanylate cyclase (GGDEF)-like protein
MRTAWSRYLLCGAVALAAFALAPIGRGRALLYVLIGASGVVAVAVGVRRDPPERRRAWHRIALGNVAWIVGDSAVLWYRDVAARPLPQLWGLPFAIAYALLASGMIGIGRGHGTARRPAALLDASIASCAWGLMSWVFLIEPAWDLGGSGVLDRVIDTAYPMGDVVLLAIGVHVATAHGTWTTASRLLTASLGSLLVTDTLIEASMVVPAMSGWAPRFESGWLLAYVLWGATALHPGRRTPAGPAAGRDTSMLASRLAGLSAAMLLGPALIAGELAVGMPLDIWPVVIGSTILVLLVLLRMTRLVHQSRDHSAHLITLANTDLVTGLENRRRFAERIGELLAWPSDDAALLLIDLERFSQINEALGYRMGDAVLHAVGQRLTGAVGASGVVARVGGDAFGILDRSIRTAQESDAAAARIRAELERPYELVDLSVAIEVSIGVVRLPQNGPDPALALHRADIALSVAQLRPGRIARYDAELETGSALAPMIIGELRGALDHGDVVLHYQPQVEIRTGRVFGVEALARWDHADRGLLGPDTFVAAAEQTGLIGPLTQYVLDHALRQCATWRRGGLDLTVAVNISTANLLNPGLPGVVRAALDRHRLTAGSLELEITESRAIMDPQRSLQVLDALARMGVTLSIDDYGTGHSSLAYLQRLPVRRLKIDRSFVSGVVHDTASAAIVRSTIELARRLRLDVVAEGVEDDETLLVLRDMRCLVVQGFGLGHPVPGSVLPGLVDQIERRMVGILGTGPAFARPTFARPTFARPTFARPTFTGPAFAAPQDDPVPR